MFKAPDSPFLVPFDGNFRISETNTCPPGGKADRSRSKEALATAGPRLRDLQRRLVANDRLAVLLIFQGMDASGKDGTIRSVLQAMDPGSFVVHSFQKPTRRELDHDFLWRSTWPLPERGRIGVFNRSQYEEVLVVRVHPEILARQQLPAATDLSKIWDERLESISDQERHLARNGTVILKFWLNVSPEAQRRRFLSRLDTPHKNWKFNPDDLVARRHWDHYMHCYEAALNATSRPWAPWFAIPADNKPYMRAAVAEIIVDALTGLGLEYPRPDEAEMEKFAESRASLLENGG